MPESPPSAGRRARRRTWAVGLLLVALTIGGGVWGWSGRTGPPSLKVAEALLAAGNPAGAAREAERVAALTPNDPRAWLVLARARNGLGDPLGAASALGRVPEWSVRKAEALLRAGRALLDAGRGREAERAFGRCIARDPTGRGPALEARMELLKLYVLEGRYDDFKAMVWAMYDLLPASDRLGLLIFRMRFELETTRPESDIPALRKLVDADPGDAPARAALATAQMRTKRMSAARENFERALADQPDDVAIRERYLDFLFAEGDFAGLKKVLEGRSEAAEDRSKTWKYLGILAERAHEDDAAAAAFARAAELAPAEPEFPHRLALILYRRGRRAEADARATERARLRAARADLRAVWDRFADSFRAHPPRVNRANLLAMARACEAGLWTREAAAFYREALRLRPDDPDARTGLKRLAGI